MEHIFNLEELQRQWDLEESLLNQQQRRIEEYESLSNESQCRTYIARDHAAAHARLVKDCFAESPTYNDHQFRRRYRMQRQLFVRIVNSISNYDVYFTQRRNNAGKQGLSPLQKCTAAMRMLTYGVAADACDEYVKIGKTTATECLVKFCEGIIFIFEVEYLRRPTQKDLQRLLQVDQKRGFPGMIGSIHCMHWQWKNCPKAWQGQCTSGHKGTSTLILEAVASYDLWI